MVLSKELVNKFPFRVSISASVLDTRAHGTAEAQGKLLSLA